MKVWTLLITLFCSCVSAEIYQWRDEQGHVHFSDRVPDGVKAEQKEPQINEGLRFASPEQVRHYRQRLEQARLQREYQRQLRELDQQRDEAEAQQREEQLQQQQRAQDAEQARRAALIARKRKKEAKQ